jgi:hypothetical protein
MRIPFLSAMGMIGADENQPHSYLDFVDGGMKPTELEF